MLKKLFSWFFIFEIIFYSCNTIFAETIEEEIAKLKAKIIQLEQRLAQQENKTIEVECMAHGAKREINEFIEYKPGEGIEIKPAELTIGAGGTFILQGTNNANGNDLYVTEDLIFYGFRI